MTLHAFPPVTTPPGYGNINRPGGGPGAPTTYGSINNPGGPPINGHMVAPQQQWHWGVQGGGRGRDGRRGEHRRPEVNPYYYGVPYPAYYFMQPYAYAPEPPEPEPPPPPAEPMYYGPPPAYPEPPAAESSSPHLYYVPPQTTGALPEDPPKAFEPQLGTSARPKAKTVTLLAFKDQTVVAVTDYWLKGEEIHYNRSDTEVGIPIEQLDFATTQQLNQERNVPFTLESRP